WPNDKHSHQRLHPGISDHNELQNFPEAMCGLTFLPKYNHQTIDVPVHEHLPSHNFCREMYAHQQNKSLRKPLRMCSTLLHKESPEREFENTLPMDMPHRFLLP